MHLYYLSVINHLLQSSELFSQYFAIRHPLPPYSFEYALLFGLSKIMSALMAEKVIICLFIFLFCAGFRYLVTSLRADSAVLAFCAIPLSLNWVIGMGFVNYALSFAFSLFALGVWIRATKARAFTSYFPFLAIIVLILFTHPVPLLVVIAFIWSHTALNLIQSYRYSAERTNSSDTPFEIYRTQIIALLLATCSLGYIALFVSTKQTSENLHHRWIQGGMIRDYLRLHPLVMTFGGLGSSLYRICLYAMLAGALLIGFRGFANRFKTGRLGAGDLMLAGAALVAVFYPLLPRSINGSDFFADRLVLYIWLFAVAGCAARLALDPRTKGSIALAIVLISVLSLTINDRQVRSAANILVKIEQDPLPPQGHTGIFIYAPVPPGEELLTFNPYFWSAARYFRRTNTVLLNSPWLELPILPLAPTGKLFTNLFPPLLMNHPDRFAGDLIKTSKSREMVSPRTDFILFVGYSDRDPKVVDDVVKANWPQPWTCKRPGWYAVCSK